MIGDAPGSTLSESSTRTSRASTATASASSRARQPELRPQRPLVPSEEYRTALALLLVRTEKAVYGLTYGMGHLMIDPVRIDPGFGIEFAVRCLNEDRITKIRRQVMDARGRTAASSNAGSPNSWPALPASRCRPGPSARTTTRAGTTSRAPSSTGYVLLDPAHHPPRREPE
ncbi:DUF6119 family protein [Nonomuraea turcica]|uniref:DUF6119 family protein n=1 Tax=Nonomuraea sp. G32 TaxID=3067274 RepID=UPI00273C92CC|nr:DUF6119 family protein [Nonomuraea sp. G32]MDP4510653.1 TIGR04141 family sporadically distributed protein [Nonomuraea sp. G32]